MIDQGNPSTDWREKKLILTFLPVCTHYLFVHIRFDFFFNFWPKVCSFLADGCIAKLFKSRFSFTRLLDGISLFFVRLRCKSSRRQQCLQCPKKLRSCTYRRWTHWKIFLWRGVVHFYLEFEIFSPKVKFFTDFYGQ